MSMRFLHEPNRRFCLLAASLGAAALLSSASVSAQDHMGMAELYGQGVVNSLGNQIRGAGIQSSMRQEGSTQGHGAAAPAHRWPAHITGASVAAHTFSVDEIRAMVYADRARAERMLTGRAISVTGRAVRPPKADRLIQLFGADGEGFIVFALFPRGGNRPQTGDRVVVRAEVDRVRRAQISLRNAQVTGRGAPPSVARSGGVASPQSAPGTRTGQPDYQALRFRSSAAVTDALAEQFADTLAPHLQKGRGKQEIAALVRGGTLQSAFRQLLQPYGFSDRDLADVLASHLVMTWQVANASADPPRAHVLAVRDQTRESLARAGWVKAMDDAGKQRFAETLAVGAMLVAARYAEGRGSNDRRTIDLARDDARQMARTFANIDLTRYALTSQGLGPKR